MIKHKIKLILIGITTITIVVFVFLMFMNMFYVTSIVKSDTPTKVVNTKETNAPNQIQLQGNVASSTATSSQTMTSSNTLTSKMKLTFDEEFNSFSRYLDAKGNISCQAGGIGRWQTVYHFCSRTIASNEENEVYIDQNFLDYLNSRSSASTTAQSPFTLEDGILRIEAKPSDNVILSSVGPWAKYTSGLITTQFSFSQEYGYFEMRAKLPKGKGVWPAFWLLPIDKSWPPEVDALEAFGDPSSKNEGGRTLIHYASHSTTKSESCEKWYDAGTDVTESFHVYGVDVEPTGITYYFDGKPYAKCAANSGTNQPFYILINVAVGGTGSWPGTPSSLNKWPAYMYIDYVRAYKKT